MNRGRATRAAVEAANHTATGFFQGIGFAAGAGILALIGTLIFHPFLLLAGVVTGGVAAYKWRRRKRPQQQTKITILEP